MAEDQRVLDAQKRLLADFSAHPMAVFIGSRSMANKLAADIALELAAKYLGEQISLRDEIKKLRKDNKTFINAFMEAVVKESNLERGNIRLRDDLSKLRESNSQLQADMQAIMNKLQRLQPGGSPPPTGDSVANAYWIIDSVINSGYYPKV